MHLLFVFSVLSRPCSRIRIYNVVQVKWIGDRFWCQNIRYQKIIRTPNWIRSSYYSRCGAEDEIWTRATITDATPLAGEPLEPLGYFCNVSKEKFSISCFNAILLYHISIKKSKLFTRPNQKFRVKNRKNEKIFLSVCCQPWFFNKYVIQYWYWKRAGARKSDNDRKQAGLK